MLSLSMLTAPLVHFANAATNDNANDVDNDSRWRDLNYYELLGLQRDDVIDAKQLKAAYRQQAKQWHPDKSNSTTANERFAAIAQAYETLSDEQLRRDYDYQLGMPGKSGNDGYHQDFDTSYADTFRYRQQRYQYHDPFSIFEEMFGDWNDLMHEFQRQHFQQQQQQQQRPPPPPTHTQQYNVPVHVARHEQIATDFASGWDILTVTERHEYADSMYEVWQQDFVEEYNPYTHSFGWHPVQDAPLLVEQGSESPRHRQDAGRNHPHTAGSADLGQFDCDDRLHAQQTTEAPLMSMLIDEDHDFTARKFDETTTRLPRRYLRQGHTLSVSQMLQHGPVVATVTASPVCDLVITEGEHNECWRASDQDAEPFWNSHFFAGPCELLLRDAQLVLHKGGHVLWESSKDASDHDGYNTMYIARVDAGDAALTVYRLQQLPAFFLRLCNIDPAGQQRVPAAWWIASWQQMLRRILHVQVMRSSVPTDRRPDEHHGVVVPVRLVCVSSTSAVGCVSVARILLGMMRSVRHTTDQVLHLETWLRIGTRVSHFARRQGPVAARRMARVIRSSCHWVTARLHGDLRQSDD